jgi:hypothetical protein
MSKVSDNYLKISGRMADGRALQITGQTVYKQWTFPKHDFLGVSLLSSE